MMLVAMKSKTRGATQADMCKFLQGLKAWSSQYARDASDLLLPETKLFADDAVVRAEHDKWATAGCNATLIANLFVDAPELTQVTLNCLQAEMLAVVDQLDRNSKQYLVGYKIARLFADETPSESIMLRREHMLNCPTTTDVMEGLYGHLDYEMTLTKTLSLKTVTGMSAWRFNKVRDFLRSLPAPLVDVIFSLGRFFAKHTHGERANNLEMAHTGKRQMDVDKEAANKLK